MGTEQAKIALIISIVAIICVAVHFAAEYGLFKIS